MDRSAGEAVDRHAEAHLRLILPELLRYFARRVDDVEDAADCLSETAAVLWRRREALPSEAEGARRWSYGVARKILAGHRRKATRSQALVEQLKEELRLTPRTDAPIDSQLREAISSLAPKDRELFLLITWDGFGVAEAGRHLSLRPEAARARYSRIKQRLRASLSPERLVVELPQTEVSQ